MNSAAADRIAKAVLYEGYMLYPYRPSAVKNQQRFNFGVVYPQPFSDAQKGTDPWTMQTECLVQGNLAAKLEVQVRFLQLVERSVEAIAEPTSTDSRKFVPVKALAVDGQTFYSWQEAIERELKIPSTDLESLGRYALQRPFHLVPSTDDEELRDTQGVPLGRIVRTQHSIDGLVEVRAQQVSEQVFKITVSVRNITPLEHASSVSRDYALMRSLVSAHVVLGIDGGEFVSLLDPPELLQAVAAGCHNQGTFPVLVGEEGQRDTVLASPIILYDYPQIAPESAGDLFDGTEIDEILSLRIMTMTDEEKSEMRQSDDRARQMLERTETMPAEQFMKLHGVLRGLRPLKEDS
jgi:hydrogenase maturation protease